MFKDKDKSRESRVENQESRVKGQESRAKSRESRIKSREPRVKSQRIKKGESLERVEKKVVTLQAAGRSPENTVGLPTL